MMHELKVLIIEDEKVARKQLARFVERQGFKVFKARDGREGLYIFKNKKPEIVITDLKMPRIDGREVLRSIHSNSPNTQVILITAYGTTDTVIEAIREGALDYIKKPLDLDQLELALGRARKNLKSTLPVPPYPTILLAEDDEITRKRLARVLRKEERQVVTAADGSEALEKFQEQKIDLVLLDIEMPRKTGLQALREMREHKQDFEAIILTGYGDEENATTALREGAHNFIRKPIDLDQMIVAVNKALETLEMKRALRYRTRELELTHEIIARITSEKEVIVDARDHTLPEARQFSECLINAVPIQLLVLNDDLTVRYVNDRLQKNIGEIPAQIDDDFLEDWLDSPEVTCQQIVDNFELSPCEVENKKLDKYSEISMTSIKLSTEAGFLNVMIIAYREDETDE